MHSNINLNTNLKGSPLYPGAPSYANAEEVRADLGVHDPSRWRISLYEPSGNLGQNPGILGITDFTFLGSAQNSWDSVYQSTLRGTHRSSSTAGGYCGMYGNYTAGRCLPTSAVTTPGQPSRTAVYEDVYTLVFSTQYGSVVNRNLFAGFRSTASAPDNSDPTTLTNAWGLAKGPETQRFFLILPGQSPIDTGVDLGSGKIYSLTIHTRQPGPGAPDWSTYADISLRVSSLFPNETEKYNVAGDSYPLFSGVVTIPTNTYGKVEHVCCYAYCETSAIFRLYIHRIEIRSRIQ